MHCLPTRRLNHMPMSSSLLRKKDVASDCESQGSGGSQKSLTDVTRMVGDFRLEASNVRPADRPAFFGTLLKRRTTTSKDVDCYHSQSKKSPISLAQHAWRIGNVYPIIPGRLHFVSAASRAQLPYSSSMVVITSDLPKQYFSFCKDFGPNNLAIVLRFCDFLAERVAAVAASSMQLVFRAPDESRIRTNSAFLLAAYLVIKEGLTPEQAIAPIEALRPYPFLGYRDATNAPVTFEISILDCLQGLAKGMSCGWLNEEKFNLPEYEHWDTPTNGDLHQISPKFIAFKGPVEAHVEQGQHCHTPAHYLAPFQERNVSAVVRLNEADGYEAEAFVVSGIRHYELYFEDCTTPSAAHLQAFFDIADREDGVVAVHCKAGLGRTGTLIAAYLMARHAFSAREAIAWLRLCRPGSVIGPQQQFLVDLEPTLNPTGSAGARVTVLSRMRRWGGRLRGREREGRRGQTPSRGSSSSSGPGSCASELAEQVTHGMEARAKLPRPGPLAARDRLRPDPPATTDRVSARHWHGTSSPPGRLVPLPSQVRRRS